MVIITKYLLEIFTEVPSTIFSLSSLIHNAIFNYQDTINNINTIDTVTYEQGEFPMAIVIFLSTLREAKTKSLKK